MYDSIVATIPKMPGLPDRAQTINVLTRVLDGRLYDNLRYQFSDEYSSGNEYIPLKHRKPSVRYNICRMVVEDSVSMLFGEGRFPTIDCKDGPTKDLIASLIDESNMAEIMIDAATRGSVGSVAIGMRILKGRVFWQAMPTMALTPAWDPDEPDRLLSVTELYQVKGKDMQAAYHLTDDQAALTYWFKRVWDFAAETWFLPLSTEDLSLNKPYLIDAARTVRHELGFCPLYWVRNLPGGDQIDGGCTFASAIETQVEIEYRLSQGGRALQYASDPLMMIREPAGSEGGEMVRSASNAIIVGADGDAKMLEIDGAASAAVVEFCRALRDIALETMHGNRANPDKMAGATSGRAHEMMASALIGLVDKLRLSYGRCVLRLLQMVVMANKKLPLRLEDADVEAGALTNKRLKLQWGPYFVATISDKQMMSATLGQLKAAGLISRESAVEQVCDYEEIQDAKTELAQIDADIAAQDARLAKQAGIQFKASATEMS